MSKTQELIQIEPLELRFPFELNKQLECSFQVFNKTTEYVAFKVKTKYPKKCCVKPNTGIIQPYSKCDVVIQMIAHKEAPPRMQSDDKFLVQSVIISEGVTMNADIKNMFSEIQGDLIYEIKLPVAYTLPMSSSSSSKNEDHNERELVTMKIGKQLLEIRPLELRYPLQEVEQKKFVPCSLQLSNQTRHYVAFKVKTTNSDNYTVRPNKGILSPNSKCDLVVTLRPQLEILPDMKCKDKFLIQSVIAREGATANDITNNMFQKESGNVVNEVKLTVAYVPPLEGSEQGDLNAKEYDTEDKRPLLGDVHPDWR